MKLFTGSSNPQLAQKIAGELGVLLGEVEITRFIDNECRVFVKEEVGGEEVFVLQSLSEVADQNLVELCLLGSALKNLHAKKVTAVIPWMGYSKQDKAFRTGEAVSAQLVAKFIEAAGFDAVITCELHSENLLPYFSIPVIELSTHNLLRGGLKNIDTTGQNMVVVAPDKGGRSRSEDFAREMGLPTVYLEKKRDLKTGVVAVVGIDGEVSEKNVVIFDDIINTGETAIKTSEFVKGVGGNSVYFLATHAVLAGNASILLTESFIDHVVVTDTIAIPQKKKFPKLSIVSAAALLADAIKQQTK